MGELQKLLRRSMALDAKLQAGALGEIETTATNKHSQRQTVLPPPQSTRSFAAFPCDQPNALPLTIGVLPPVEPPKAVRRPKFKPPPPCLEWVDEEKRYVSRAENVLGKQWRRRLHERHMFWDPASKSFVNRGQFLMNHAPGGEGGPESVVNPGVTQPRLGLAVREDAEHILATPSSSVRRGLTPKRSRIGIGGTGWESRVLENRYRQFQEEHGAAADAQSPWLPKLSPDRGAASGARAGPSNAGMPSRDISAHARGMRMLHENSIHARFLTRSMTY
eukprot:6638370-Prymnesium_polylepis.2